MRMRSATAQGMGARPGRADVSTQSVGELVANLSENTSRLLRQEVALAKTETRTEMRATGRALRTLTVAGGIALVALTMLSLAGARGLSQYLDLGWAYLIVGVLWTMTAVILYSKGRNALDGASSVPERTKNTLNEVPNVVTGR